MQNLRGDGDSPWIFTFPPAHLRETEARPSRGVGHISWELWSNSKIGNQKTAMVSHRTKASTAAFDSQPGALPIRPGPPYHLQQVWMTTRYDLDHTFWITVVQSMFLSFCKAFVLETSIPLCSLGSWTALLARTEGVDPISHHCQQAFLDLLP
ncbi:hypothetical protein R6Z07M_006058 [Ovis aries]